MALAKYYPEPYSVSHITPEARVGILIMASLGVLSLVTTFAVVVVIAYRLVIWRKEYRRFIGQNQCMVLVLNLFLADSIMGLGAALGFRWIQVGGILAPTGWCWAQAGLLHFGDLANGFFVLALGLQTLATFVRERAISYEKFCFVVLFIWILTILLTVIGPLRHGADFFARTENWCWISEKYNFEGLWLHYLWVFIVEFSTLVIYGGLFLHLNQRLAMLRAIKSTSDTPERLVTVMRSMALYPIAYMALTFPMAFSRMEILAGQKPTSGQMATAAALISSCGWINALLYSFTRRVLVHTDLGDREQLKQTQSESGTSPLCHISELSEWPAQSSRRNSGTSKRESERNVKLDPRLMRIVATTEIDVFEKDATGGRGKVLPRQASTSTMTRKWFPA